jgi:tRNA 2-thiouridine synthesizing protein A
MAVSRQDLPSGISTLRKLDVRGAPCPVPILKAKLALETMQPGERLEVYATDPSSVPDFQEWTKVHARTHLASQRTETEANGQRVYVHVLERRA